MVTVKMLRQNGQLVGFHASGHAGQGPYGEDIVCSAISALTQTAILGLEKIVRAPMGVEVDEQKGIHCVLGSDCTQAQWHDAQIVLETMRLGLQEIQSAYAQTLSILEREV